MSDERKLQASLDLKRLIDEFGANGPTGETDEEQGLAVLDLLRDIVRLLLKYRPNVTIPVDDDRKFAEWLGQWSHPNPEHATFEAILKRLGQDPSAAIAYLQRKIEIVSERQSQRGSKKRLRSQDIFFHIIRECLADNPNATQGEVLQYLKDSDGIAFLDGFYRHDPTAAEVTERALKHRIYRAKKIKHGSR